MARTAREKCESNIYHVMLRGVNRQNIFEEDADKFHFMNVLGICKEKSGFRLHAFVLMSNHVHLLIEPAGEPLDLVFRRIGTRYAVWFNRKYQRSGHLFQNRYRSESIRTDAAYRTVLRYILQNPMKAGMESRPGTYRWSSYAAYEKGKAALTDVDCAMRFFDSREILLDFLGQNNNDLVMDVEDHDWLLREDKAKEVLKLVTNCASASDFQRLDASRQKEYIWKLYLERLSMGMIARLTGISKSTVSRIIRQRRETALEPDEVILRESEADMFPVYAEIIW